MYDKQKMMMAYVMVFIVVMIAKIAFESSRICESVAPHIVGTMVTLCLIIILVQSTKINVNTRATIGLILIYALDMYFSIFDKRFLHTPLVFMVLSLVAGALLEQSIVLMTIIICTLMTVVYCILWPALAFETLSVYQVIYMMAIANISGGMMYLATRWANKVIAEGNKKAQEADHANVLKSQFLASASHEIRTPMNAIFGMNELILAASPTADIGELKQKAMYIKTSGLDLLALINDILDVSKLDQGKTSLVETPYNATEMFEAVIHELQGLIGPKPLTIQSNIQLSISADLIGDDVSVRQVLSKLLSNAVKFTPEGSIGLAVRQEAVPEGVNIIASVSDTGCGIDEESIALMLENHGESYLRENKETGGIGIGLSIAIRLLNMMNGKLEIKSELGKGSTFTVIFPQRISQTPVKPTIAATAQDRPTLSGARVLVVDDNSTNIQVSRGIFKRYALDIDTALSGQEAVIKATRIPYDLIFMDHMMPGMDGLQAMRAIRALGDEHNEKVPVVVLTADNSKEMEKSLLNNGFDAYLCKPLNTMELTRVLRTYLGRFVNPEKIDATSQQYALGLVLPGVSVQKGIQNSGGTLEAYINVLSIFHRTAFQQARIFEHALEEEDLTLISIEAHSLKSVAGSIGAERLATMSANLELQAKGKDVEHVKTSIRPLLSELQKLLETIASALKERGQSTSAPQKGSLDENALIEQLEKLSSAAESYDLDAASEIFKELMEFTFPETIAEKLQEIGNSVKAYAYTATLENAQQLILLLRANQASKGGGNA